ncbi:MAG TPA: hypothetical protein VGK48_03200 [Terriglobia bacterium]|jgi:hypothetical protein
MRTSKWVAIMAGVTLWALSFAGAASAHKIYPGQGIGKVDAGTDIAVRTNERIRANGSDGRVFSGAVAEDVRDRRGDIVIPRGSPVELMVRELANNDFVVDLDSVMIDGDRYGVDTNGNVVGAENGGLGTNKTTGEYVGGGAVLGAIIGAIAGGGKGAAIGAGAGAAGGAGTQVLTRGRDVDVPAESLLTFRLAEPLRAGVADNGYLRNGIHYHQGHETQQAFRQKPGAYSSGRGTLSIGRDNKVSWQGSESGFVYVQMDNQEPKLFASGQSGVEAAPWMNPGHLYVFTFKDANGNVLASDRLDLRR